MWSPENVFDEIFVQKRQVRPFPSHRQTQFDPNHHEAPLHDRRKEGGHVLLKHVDLNNKNIDRKFTKKKPVVSLFTSMEEAECVIHKVLNDNASKIDGWFRNARDGNAILLEGHTSGGGTVVIERANRQRKTARRIQVTIVKKEHNGMIYYVQTVKLD